MGARSLARYTADIVHRQYPRRRVIVDRCRNDDPVVPRQDMLQAFEIRRLASIVELLDERRTELAQQSVYRVPPSDLGILCDGVDDLAEGIEIAQDLLADVRPLNLDRHLAPIP